VISQEAAWRPAPVARALKSQQGKTGQKSSLPEEGVPPERISAAGNAKRAVAALKQRDIAGIAHNMPIEMLASAETDATSPPWWCHVGPVRSTPCVHLPHRMPNLGVAYIVLLAGINAQAVHNRD
jgi:hypothetical protein